MKPSPDQQAINALVQKLRPKQPPKNAQSNGHASEASPDRERPSDAAVLERLFGEPEGQKWREIYGGNWKAYYDSQSAADAAILHKLAFWTDRDGGQMERVARGSGLARDKWDDRRGGSTWLADEIARAVENTPGGYDWVKPEVRSRSRSPGSSGMSDEENHGLLLDKNRLARDRVQLADVLAHGIKPPPFQQPGILVRGAMHLYFGAPECGKSWLALWLAVKAITRGERVLYLDSENGKRIVAGRLKALGATEEAVREYLYYLPHPDLDLSAEAWADYGAFLDEVEPELVIFDSWVNFLSQAGLSEDSSTDVEAWAQAYLFPARNRGITTVILDHVPHETDRPRGSSRKTAVVDYSRNVRKRREFDRETLGEIQLRGGKDREGVMPLDVVFTVGGRQVVGGAAEFVFEPGGGVVETTGDVDGLKPSERKVLDVLRSEFGEDGATHTEWLKAFVKERRSHGIAGGGETTFKRSKKRLIELELVLPSRVQNAMDPTDKNQYPRDTVFRAVSDGSGPLPLESNGPDLSAGTSQKPHSGPLGSKSGPKTNGPDRHKSGPLGHPPLRGWTRGPDAPDAGDEDAKSVGSVGGDRDTAPLCDATDRGEAGDDWEQI